MKTLHAMEERFPAVTALAESVLSLFLTAPLAPVAACLRLARAQKKMEKDFDASTVRSVLITRLDGLGDLVLFSSFVREARNLFPNAHITLVVDGPFASFVEECPWVDEVIGFSQSRSKYVRAFLGFTHAGRFSVQRLSGRKFDLAISPRWECDTKFAALINYLSLPRYHFGFSEKVSRRKSSLNRGLNILFSHLAPSKPGIFHEVDRNAEMLKALGGDDSCIRQLELWLSESDRAYARRILASHEVSEWQPVIGLGLGATAAKRLWPIERFSALAVWLAETYAAKILIVGDAKDARNAEPLKELLGGALIDVSGNCTIRESGALLSMCDGFIGNDSGPMHLAAASGIPVIELSCHPRSAAADYINSPKRYAPLSPWNRVLQPEPATRECENACNASEAHCILNLELDEVKAVARQMMQEAMAVGEPELRERA